MSDDDEETPPRLSEKRIEEIARDALIEGVRAVGYSFNVPTGTCEADRERVMYYIWAFQSRVNHFCDLLDKESAQERRNERKIKRVRLIKQLQELDYESEEDTKNVRE
jgi:hypothetical protein